jgi:uncharacterized surface protein with fasciclin (FAS1) repeats
MNTVIKIRFVLFVVLLAVMGLIGCDDNKDIYKDPPWLGGSSIDTLSKNENYSIFLELMKKAKYEEPIEKQLFTLFVPNNDAFKSYFSTRGITSVDDLSEDEAEELFTLHVLRNPRSKFQMIYEYAWGELQGPQGEYASLFFRKQTYSKVQPYREEPRYVKGFADSMWIYATEKLMPFYSDDFFEDIFGANDGSDYLFMYPDGKWTGLAWGPAAVTDAEVRTSSGFIYFIDRVVPPQQSIEQYLIANQQKFGVFYDLMQRFANYTGQMVYKDKRIMYRKTYRTISDLAEEQGPSPSADPVVPNRMRDFFTVFIPNDNVLQNYLDNTVLKYYPSLDSVPDITLYYILQSQISRSIGLISKLEQSYFNFFGDPISITRNNIVSSIPCSNGIMYETNGLLEPDVFTCVPGQLFFDKNYSTFLYALTKSNFLSTLTNPNSKVTLFAPSNDELYELGIQYNEQMDRIEQINSDLKWVEIKIDDLVMLVQDHIYKGNADDLSGEGFLEMASQNFIYYNNNTVSAGGNAIIGETSKIVESYSGARNGMLHKIEQPINSSLKMGEYIYNEPDFSDFMQLLAKAELLDTTFQDPTLLRIVPNLKFIGEAYFWTAFIPTNAAMATARAAGLVPDDSDLEVLKKFLLYHFVRKTTIFDDGKETGVFPTNMIESSSADGAVYATLSIDNSPKNMVLTDHSGKTVAVNHANANALVRYGVVHKINSVLKY